MIANDWYCIINGRISGDGGGGGGSIDGGSFIGYFISI